MAGSEGRMAALSAVLVFVASLAGGLIGGYASWVVASVESQTTLRERAVSLAFEGDPSGIELSQRISVLGQLLPEELNGWQALDQEEYPYSSRGAAKWAYLNAVADKAECPEQVVAAYVALYGSAEDRDRRYATGTRYNDFSENASPFYDIVLPACPGGSG